MRIYTTKKTETKSNNKGRTILILLLWLVLWEGIALIINNELLFPSPVDTVKALFAVAATKKFYLNVGWTLLRCLISMILSFFIGMVLAWIAYNHKLVRSILSLPIGFFKAVPVMAIIIYVILVLNADLVAIVVCFLMCLPIAYTNCLSGFDRIDEKLLELSWLYELKKGEQIRLVFLPGILPEIKSAIQLIAGISWKAVVAAEVLSIPKYSIGYEMMNAKYYLLTSELFAYIAVIVILSLALEKLIKTLVSKKDWKGYSEAKVRRNISTNNMDCGAKVQLKNISKSFGDKSVLDNGTFEIKENSVNVIVGPSGIGKTTLARIIAGLETQDSGEIIEFKAQISYLFQEDRLLPWLNVRDNMALGMRNTVDEKIETMAKALELEGVLGNIPDELSGGQKHRVSLGRAFLAEANLLILDEPFRGLHGKLINKIIEELWVEAVKNKTVILITHDMNLAKKLGDNIINLDHI